MAEGIAIKGKLADNCEPPQEATGKTSENAANERALHKGVGEEI